MTDLSAKAQASDVASDGTATDEADRQQNGQFRKGVSGNPRGRPKGARGLLQFYKVERDTRVPVKVNGRMKYMTKLEAFVVNTMNRAIAGDAKAAASLLVMERALGGLDPEVDEDAIDPAESAILKDLLRRRGGAGDSGSADG